MKKISQLSNKKNYVERKYRTCTCKNFVNLVNSKYCNTEETIVSDIPHQLL